MDIAGLSPLNAYGSVRPPQPVSLPQPVDNSPAVGGAGRSQNGGTTNAAPNDKPLSDFGPRLGGGVQSTLLAAQETARDAAKTPAPAQVASGRGAKATPSSLNLSV